MTTLEQALRLAALGLSVIPIPPPDDRHDGKRPAIAWAPYQQRRATEEEIREWFSTPQNIGIVCGAVSGIVAADLDDEIARRWWTRHRPKTPWQVKTARGWHVYYALGEPVTNYAHDATVDPLAIDIRSTGGYVIGPGSTHRSGAAYTMAGDWTQPRHALPVFDPAWHPRRLRPPRRAPMTGRPARPVAAEVLTRARCYLAAIPVPAIGSGSDNATFYAACRLVRGFALDAATAEDLLWGWCGGRPGWTREWVRRKVRAAEQYGTEAVRSLCVH